MPLLPFNSVGGYSTGITATNVIDANGNISASTVSGTSLNISGGNLTITGGNIIQNNVNMTSNARSWFL